MLPLSLARLLASGLELYVLLGVVFALAFLPRGIVRVDERLHASPWRVRLLLMPGVIALWPLFARRWRQAVDSTSFERSSS